MTQSTISNISWDILLLGLLLGSVDPHTCVVQVNKEVLGKLDYSGSE